MPLPQNLNKIIVRCPNWVGDIVMATPIFTALRQTFPKAQIAALVRNYACEILDGTNWFDQIIGIDDKTKTARHAQISAIRNFKPDAAIVLPNSWSALLPIWRAGCPAIYGYKRNGRGILLKDGPRPPRDGFKVKAIPTTDYYAGLGNYLGLKMPAVIEPHLFVSDPSQAKANDIYTRHNIKPTDIVIGLNPGASFGSSKCWPGTYYARLAELLEQQYNCRIFMFTAPGEEAIAQEIMTHTKAAVIDMRKEGLNLSLLKPLIKRCQLLVTNDTGPRHYAVAFGIPVAVIFGSTDPGLTASNLEKTVTIRLELECSPCQQKVCPLKHHRCMQDLTVETVFDQIIKLYK